MAAPFPQRRGLEVRLDIEPARLLIQHLDARILILGGCIALVMAECRGVW